MPKWTSIVLRVPHPEMTPEIAAEAAAPVIG